MTDTSSRLPGKCASCGARVELSLGDEPIAGTRHNFSPQAMWLDRGTRRKHTCPKAAR